MADHGDQVNMNDAMFSANTFGVKEEQCQENSFVEDKVCISETAITTDNAEIRDFIWHGKIKQYEESTCLDNIKRELTSFEATDVQNDNVKVQKGISARNIKIEISNGLLYCEHCEAFYQDYCIKCGMLVHVLNKHALNNADYGAREDIPNDILEIQDFCGQIGIYALRMIPAGVKFGPFTGLSTTDCPWEMKGEKFVLDKNKWKFLNWMQYVNPTKNTCDGNLHVFQCEDIIYYQSTRQIQAELMQCPICKIYMDPKEYSEHHMTYCCERNVRKCIQPTPPTKQATTALNERKRCPRQTYKCEQCKYRTRYPADLKKHNKQHYQFKMFKCGICNRRFKTKEYLTLHLGNTHSYAEGKDAQEHSTPDYRKTIEQPNPLDQKKIFKCSLCVFRTKYKQFLRGHINTIHLKKFDYKCDSCEFATKNKNYLEKHIKTKHLKLFDYKCASCEFGSNSKSHLEYHIKSIHLKQFDHKCDFCEFGTNSKYHLEYHLKTKHLKKFDHKCDSCEFGTNRKYHLEYHLKTKHLKEFDYKCDSCEYETNSKHYLEKHIKTKHLKEFDFKCDSCEYITNRKYNLEYHLKTKHLKEFDYKCDSCEYRSSTKCNLKVHIKTRHLKKFEFKCDSCEFQTNGKFHLERHIKTKHLKEFDFRCDSCEYRTNRKYYLETHIKTKHLKEFDYKCDSCQYRTNSKYNLEVHVNTLHLKGFDYKCGSCEFEAYSKCHLERHVKIKHLKTFYYTCDSCEFGTNNKYHLELHIKTKHLMQFDYKCDSCGYRTNRKYYFEYHIKTIHLKEFDYKCDSCEYETNRKSNLAGHTKRKHL